MYIKSVQQMKADDRGGQRRVSSAELKASMRQSSEIRIECIEGSTTSIISNVFLSLFFLCLP